MCPDASLAERVAALRVVLVAGLPGSGKTCWAAEQLRALRARGSDACVLDDPQGLAEVETLLNTAALQLMSTVYVTDPKLCRGQVLSAALAWFAQRGIQAEVVYFQNDPARCLQNARRGERVHRQVDADIRQLARDYFPPQDAMAVYGDAP